jgi:hypothetical protein
MTAMSFKQTCREYERLLATIYGLLINCGLRHNAVSTLSERALKSAIAKARVYSDSSGAELATFSLVLDSWHRDRRYVTSRGRPRAVPLLGRSPSVEALIRAEAPNCDALAFAQRIQSLQLIRPCAGDRYRPTSDAALVSIYGPTVLQYVARCLVSLLDTVDGNLRGVRDTPSLLQRSAEVPDLPVDYVESFQQFSRVQGAIFLRTINDWLETRRARGPSARGQKNVRAGVHIHAYVALPKSGARLARRG